MRHKPQFDKYIGVEHVYMVMPSSKAERAEGYQSVILFDDGTQMLAEPNPDKVLSKLKLKEVLTA